MCSYDLENLLQSTSIALDKLFPQCEEKDKILPCALLAGFQLIGKESEKSLGSLHIDTFETPEIKLISPNNELDALREAITQVYKDPPTGWLKIKDVYEKYIQEKGELNESNNT